MWDGTFCKIEDTFFPSSCHGNRLITPSNPPPQDHSSKSLSSQDPKNMVVEKYAPGNPAWHFKMRFLSTSGIPEFFSKVTTFWSLLSLYSRIRWAKLMNRINYFQGKCQLTCIKKIFSLSLFRGCKLCFRSKDFSAWWDGKESRTFKPREPLKAILKIVFCCRILLSLMNLVGLAGSPAGSCSLCEVWLLWSSSISTLHLKAAALPDVLMEQLCQPGW